MRRAVLIFAAALGAALSLPQLSSAERNVSRGSAARARNPEFRVPTKLRPRVDFWIDIFTKYGKHQSVIHHRNFPQAVFGVLDFRQEAASMSPVAFERYRKKRIDDEVREVEAAMKHLASGKVATTPLQRRIAEAMSFLPHGSGKYRTVVKEGLIRTQTGIRERYAEAVNRSGRYMHILEKVFVEEYNLPVELTRLPFVESSFDYKAYSSAGAAGIWQFMPATARTYKMRIDNLVDERRDVIASTRGAAQYLQHAYRVLGNWPLALTSYNHGVAGVGRKVKAAGTTDIVRLVETHGEPYFGFASSNFYPEFLAALEVYDNLPHYFPEVAPEPPRHLLEYPLPYSASPQYVSQKLGLDVETLESLNYALSKRVWQGRSRIPAGYSLKLPAEYELRLAALQRAPAQPVAPASSSVHGGTVYRVRPGDTLSGIARRYRTSVSQLRAYNNLDSDLVRVGELLVVKQDVTSPKPAGSAGTATTYTVQRGDTLSEIGARFGVPVASLRLLNGLSSSDIRVGQVLKIRSVEPVTAPSSSQAVITHQVRSGDSLYALARRYDSSVAAIRAANNLEGNRIRIGQALKIPTSVALATHESAPEKAVKTYKVRAGDSLWKISRKFRVPVADLRRANKLRSSSLHIGQTLIIP